ncbi:hypothetical protein SAMN06265370_1245 [Puniceibacterium sediminis]|uniref:Uncharacterized protein n=1 Tax=Puniceibacterium sediminis TaxID=1608407 RepID=A0A238Z3W9_9RHOB|nr:hypothetical protein SAMN06265370_1245 [Puniceibacterium sediminis]
MARERMWSEVTVQIPSSCGFWSRNSGRTGLSPSRLAVNSTARISDVAVSIAEKLDPGADPLPGINAVPGSYSGLTQELLNS